MSLEHYIGDGAVAVEVNRVIVLKQVFADHLALHMTCFGSIGADKCAFIIAVDNFVCNLAVEEDDGDARILSSVASLLCSIGRGGLNNVDYQQVCAVCDSGVDRVKLSCLIGVAVIVGVVDACAGEQLIHSVANSGYVGVGVIVIEHAYVKLGRSGVYGSFGSFGSFGSLAGAACKQSDQQNQSKSKS